MFAINNTGGGVISAYTHAAAERAFDKLQAQRDRPPAKDFDEFCALMDETNAILEELHASGERVDAKTGQPLSPTEARRRMATENRALPAFASKSSKVDRALAAHARAHAQMSASASVGKPGFDSTIPAASGSVVDGAFVLARRAQ